MSNSSGHATILVVDDEPGVRAVLREAFEGAGFAVVEASGRIALLDVIARLPVDLVTLDLDASDGERHDLPRLIRASRNIPIVVITGSGAHGRVGLEHGTDDYITKPFHVREVIARVRSALHRYRVDVGSVPADLAASQAPALLAFDHKVFDFHNREVRSDDGRRVELTDVELVLLALLLRHPARILSRTEISRALNGDDDVSADDAFDAEVTCLRAKIEPPSHSPTLIKHVHGVGYVFAGQVRRA